MGNATLVRRLHKAGADVDAKDLNGNSVLEFTARSGQVEIVELLLELGADLHSKDKQGATAGE